MNLQLKKVCRLCLPKIIRTLPVRLEWGPCRRFCGLVGDTSLMSRFSPPMQCQLERRSVIEENVEDLFEAAN
jgi:hypothetical protein